jgi:diketogulonate reductase-like aldo/keto reductase
MRKHKIVSNQVRYNLIDRTVEFGLLEYCWQHNITVIAHSALATEFSSIGAKDPERVIDKVAQARSKTAAQIALNWCISKKGVVTIPKANFSRARERKLCGLDFQLSQEELKLLDQKVEYGRRGSVEICLRHIARQGLQYLGKNRGQSS